MGKLERLVEAKTKAVTDDLSAKITSVNSQLNANVASLTNDLKEADYKFASTEAQDPLGKGVYSNTLRRYLEMLDISINRQWTWRVSDDLELIQNLLKKYLPKTAVSPTRN